MGKRLSEMSLQELWELFPIFLTEHRACWKDWYLEEEAILRNIGLPSNRKRISHIGSTSIATIWAKPIIDILLEVSQESNFSIIKDRLLSNGYLCMKQSENRISFNKGYTENGFSERVFHLHLRFIGDNDELYFRDYLIDYPEVAKEYEKMKLQLWKRHENNRDAYTLAKTEFIMKVTKKAKEVYINKC